MTRETQFKGGFMSKIYFALGVSIAVLALLLSPAFAQDIGDDETSGGEKWGTWGETTKPKQQDKKNKDDWEGWNTGGNQQGSNEQNPGNENNPETPTEIVAGELTGGETPGVKPAKKKEKAKPLTPEEIAFMFAGASFWSPKLVTHAHFGLALTFTDWEGTTTTGTGSHMDLSGGIEYAFSGTPLSAIADLGFRVTNKNPWDTDTSFFAGWAGVKFLAFEPEVNAEKGLSLAASLLAGFGTGDNEHENNFGIWLGHHHPVLFQFTPVLCVSVSYQINKTMAVAGEVMGLYYLADDITPTDEIGLSIAAEYYIAVSVVGFHFGLNFRTTYSPQFSIYASAIFKVGPYIMMAIPFGSDVGSTIFALTVGYDLKF